MELELLPGEVLYLTCRAQLQRAPAEFDLPRAARGRLTVSNQRMVWTQDGETEPAVTILGTTVERHWVLRKGMPKVRVRLSSGHEYVFALDDDLEKKRMMDLDVIDTTISKVLKPLTIKQALADGKSLQEAVAAAAPASAVSAPSAAHGHVQSAAAHGHVQSAAAAGSASNFDLRASALADDEELARNMEQFVTTGVLTEEEFWDAHREELQKAEARAAERAQQVIMTSVLELQIFEDDPAVERAFQDQVPHKKSREKFWQDYWASARFHKSKTATAGRAESGGVDPAAMCAALGRHGTEPDPFAKYERSTDWHMQGYDDEQARKQLQALDPSVDLTATQADAVSRNMGQAGFGVFDRSQRVAPPLQQLDVKLASEQEKETLERAVTLQKLNARAFKVMAQASGRAAPPELPPTADARTLRHELHPDLDEQPAPQHILLRVADPRLYFESALTSTSLGSDATGMAASAAVPAAADSVSGADEAAETDRLRGMTDDLSGLFAAPGALPNPAVTEALHALARAYEKAPRDTTPAAQAAHDAALASKIPVEFLQTLQAFAVRVNEILRHIWACTPPRSQAMLDRFNRMYRQLELANNTLNSTRSSLPTEHRHVMGQMMRPLQDQISAMFEAREEFEGEVQRTMTMNTGH